MKELEEQRKEVQRSNDLQTLRHLESYKHRERSMIQKYGQKTIMKRASAKWGTNNSSISKSSVAQNESFLGATVKPSPVGSIIPTPQKTPDLMCRTAERKTSEVKSPEPVTNDKLGPLRFQMLKEPARSQMDPPSSTARGSSIKRYSPSVSARKAAEIVQESRGGFGKDS